MPRPTPPALIGAVLATACLATAWVPMAASGQTTTEPIPVDAEFGDLGVGWINRFGQHLPVPDIDGNGTVTNADFIAWLGYRLPDIPLVGDIPVVDLDDPDGVTPCQQAAVALANYLRLVAGDVTLDGVVDQADVQKITQALLDLQQGLESPNSPAFVQVHDVNQDDVVSEADVHAVVNAMGSVVGDTSLAAAQTVIATTPECGGGGPGPAHWEGHYRHPTHAVVFSDGYPTHDRSATGTLWKRHFPNDHASGVSLTWPLTIGSPPEQQAYPAHGLYRSAIFPPNHYYFASQNWPQDSSTHTIDLSRDWPPNHGGNISAEWYPNPTLLPPNVLPHEVHISTQWDANHRPSDSREIQVHNHETSDISNRSPHLSAWSASWVHAAVPSASVFPPNHVGSFSIGWNHSYSISLSWPAGHSHSPSSGWPTDKDPRWPPNHFEALSEETLEPGQTTPLIPPGIFPSDHSLWTTGLDLVPIIGD